MRVNPFESELERLARTLTEQFGVQVVCQGENAWTDGRQIVLPSVPEPMDEGLERMVLGYMDHEMAHVVFSDFRVVGEFMKKHPGREGLLNVVEDALIERRAMERWPGVRRNLDGMFAQIRPRLVSLIAQREPFDRFCTAIYLKLAHYHDMVGLDHEVAGYEDLLDQFPHVRETRDAARLAGTLLERWLRKGPSQSNGSQSSSQSQGGQQKNSRQHRDGHSDGQSDSSSDKGPERPSENAGHDDEAPDANRQQSDGTNGQPNQIGSDNATGASSSNPSTEDQPGTSPPSTSRGDGQSDQVNSQSSIPITTSDQGGTLIGEAIREAITEAVRQLDGSRQYRVYTKQFDCIDVVVSADASQVQALRDTGGDTVRRLRRGLTNALRSAEKRWWRDEQLRGQLSQRTLYRLCMDRPRLDVFRIQASVQGKSSAVSILLDASGSMHTRKMDVALRAVRVLLEALGDLRIATEALTFTTGNGVDVPRVLQETGLDASKLRDRYGRISNLQIGLLKRFEDPVKVALERLPSIRGTGLTPLGEAMQIAAARLAPRPETRKILLVLTDGKAGCEGSGEAATAHAEHVANLITRSGIELVGVGIQDNNVCTIVKDSIVIQQLEDLPAQLCKLLGRTLQKGVQYAR